MNREDGFPSADVAVDLFHDPKVIALARRDQDEHVTATNVALYVALVLASWAAGDRIPLDEAIPAWWLGTADEARAKLHAVGLIDDESRVTLSAWESWFIPAFNRREKRKESGAQGGRRSWESRRDKRRRSDTSPLPNPSVPPAGRPFGRQAGRDGHDAVPTDDLLVVVPAPCPLCGDDLNGESAIFEEGSRFVTVHPRCKAQRGAA